MAPQRPVRTGEHREHAVGRTGLGRWVRVEVRRAGRPAARPSPRGAAAPSRRSSGRRCRARHRRPRRRRASAPRRSRRRRPGRASRRGLAGAVRPGSGPALRGVRRWTRCKSGTRFDFRRNALGHHARPMDLLETADRLFTGDLPIESHHPFSVSGQFAEIQPGLAFVDAFANSAAIDTDDGLVVVDTSGMFQAKSVHETMRRWSGQPARHRDLHPRPHRPRVRRRALRSRGARERLGTAAGRRARARAGALRSVQAHRGLQRGDQPAAVQGARLRWPLDYRYPDETYRRDLAFEVGGERFELHHARGETDDGTWVWAPDRKVVFAGDLFIWASPNCGNPQKVQRYARDWVAAFRAMAALQPDVLLPGHGLPIIGADRVRQALEDGAELLETLLDRTLGDDEPRCAPRRHRARRARAGAPPRASVPAADLRRARVRRAQHLALLRRLVRRRPVAPQARARRLRSRRSSRRSRAARTASPNARRNSRRPAISGSRAISPSSRRRPRRTTRRCTRCAPRSSGRGPGRKRRRCRRASSRGPSTSRRSAASEARSARRS